MKYIKLWLQESEKYGQIMAEVKYIEYNENLQSAAIFPALNFDTIYIPMNKEEYGRLLNFLSEHDIIKTETVGFTQPFESYESKKGNYKQMDDDIRKKAVDRNKNKKVKFE